MDGGLLWTVGIDWATEKHQVCIIDAEGGQTAERGFPHGGGGGLAALADWILGRTGATPEDVAVAIEFPHGPVVESLQHRSFTVYSINPKQLDRFHDRFFPAGAKDDRRDARVLADALHTDRRVFRPLATPIRWSWSCASTPGWPKSWSANAPA